MSHQVTVTTPADSHDLTTLAAVKQRLHIADDDTSQDAELSALITRASALVEAYLGRTLAIQTYSEDWRVPSVARRDSLVVAYTPVTALTSITEDQVMLDPATDYEFDPLTGIVYRMTDVPAIRRRWGYGVQIVYDSGYATVPADVESVCIDLVCVAKTQAVVNSNIQLELTEGVGRVAYFDRGWSSFALDDGMKCALGPYMAIVG